MSGYKSSPGRVSFHLTVLPTSNIWETIRSTYKVTKLSYYNPLKLGNKTINYRYLSF